jgi:phosphate/phosphite/phosphonate ABC transporter binding protein
MRGNELFYRAALIVRADSPLQALEQLKGRRVAWVSRSSSSGYHFPRALLASQGHDPDRWFGSEVFAGDHPAVCQAVRERRADVGATFADEPPRGRPLQADGCAESPPMSDFRVVAAGGPIPNDVIAARPGFDDRLVGPVLAAFARMSHDEEGKRILAEDFHADGWGVAVEGDFKVVQDLLRAQPRKRDEARKDARKGKALR